MAHSNEVEHGETVSVGDDCFTVDKKSPGREVLSDRGPKEEGRRKGPSTCRRSIIHFWHSHGNRDYRTLWPGTTKQASGQLGDVDRDPPPPLTVDKPKRHHQGRCGGAVAVNNNSTARKLTCSGAAGQKHCPHDYDFTAALPAGVTDSQPGFMSPPIFVTSSHLIALQYSIAGLTSSSCNPISAATSSILPGGASRFSLSIRALRSFLALAGAFCIASFIPPHA